MATAITTTGPLFQAGGLASGIDTKSIVDKIIEADSAPMLQVQKNQTAYSVQISALANLTGKLKALRTATDAIATSKLAPIQASSTYGDFTVAGQAPSEGAYSVKVEKMALTAKLRSQNFTSAQDPSAVGLTGNLQFSIDGTTSAAISTTGKSLADIAKAITEKVPQVTATVVSTGSGYRLSVVRNSTGYAVSSSEALRVVSDPGLTLDTVQAAQNALLKVDDLEVTRQTNTIADVIPGVTLNLTGQTNITTNVNFVQDASAATTKIQSFITAYNDVVTLLNAQLRPDPNAESSSDALAGTYLLSLQRDMHSLLGDKVNSAGTTQMLSDLNVSLQSDGTLALDLVSFQKTFADSVAADPQGANLLFTKATSGIAAKVDALVGRQVDPPKGQTKTNSAGALADEIKLLKDSSASLDDTISYWQVRLDSERARLTASFTAMEAVIAKLNTMSTYLNAVFNSNSSSSSSSSSK
jgi:flagellar hook-associated protein 2